MSDDDFFALPAFKPEEALVQIKRSLRELRGFSERGGGFDWSGHRAVELTVEGSTLQARLVNRPQRTPQWETRVLKSSAEVRRFLDDVRQRVARWREADE